VAPVGQTWLDTDSLNKIKSYYFVLFILYIVRKEGFISVEQSMAKNFKCFRNTISYAGLLKKSLISSTEMIAKNYLLIGHQEVKKANSKKGPT
jgi:hypothetical protein